MHPQIERSLFCAFLDQVEKSWHVRDAGVLECTLLVGVAFKRASESNGVPLTVSATVRIVDVSHTLSDIVDFVPATHGRKEL